MKIQWSDWQTIDGEQFQWLEPWCGLTHPENHDVCVCRYKAGDTDLYEAEVSAGKFKQLRTHSTAHYARRRAVQLAKQALEQGHLKENL